MVALKALREIANYSKPRSCSSDRCRCRWVRHLTPIEIAQGVLDELE